MLMCGGCGLNFHKRCAYSVQDNCTNQKDRRKSSLNADDSNSQVNNISELFHTLPNSYNVFLINLTLGQMGFVKAFICLYVYFSSMSLLFASFSLDIHFVIHADEHDVSSTYIS